MLEYDQQQHRKNFDKQPVCNRQYLNPKLNSYNGKTIIDFYNKQATQKRLCFCVVGVLADSVCKIKK